MPALRDSGGDLVVVISSAMALVGLPFYATYAGTKAGVAHFAEALRRELYGEGVKVMTVYPGATSTPMMESSQAGAGAPRWTALSQDGSRPWSGRWPTTPPYRQGHRVMERTTA